jgi:hypothetical protein
MISDQALPAQQLCKGAPWIIRARHLERMDVRAEATARRLRRPSSGDPRQESLDFREIASWAERSAFPKWQEDRHPHCHYRGLRRLHSRYGPPDCSATQGDLCHEAPVQPVTRPSRSSASGPIDNYPGEFLPH